jgi:hypothetical protein
MNLHAMACTRTRPHGTTAGLSAQWCFLLCSLPLLGRLWPGLQLGILYISFSKESDCQKNKTEALAVAVAALSFALVARYLF